MERYGIHCDWNGKWIGSVHMRVWNMECMGFTVDVILELGVNVTFYGCLCLPGVDVYGIGLL